MQPKRIRISEALQILGRRELTEYVKPDQYSTPSENRRTIIARGFNRKHRITLKEELLAVELAGLGVNPWEIAGYLHTSVERMNTYLNQYRVRGIPDEEFDSRKVMRLREKVNR